MIRPVTGGTVIAARVRRMSNVLRAVTRRGGAAIVRFLGDDQFGEFYLVIEHGLCGRARPHGERITSGSTSNHAYPVHAPKPPVQITSFDPDPLTPALNVAKGWNGSHVAPSFSQTIVCPARA